MRVHREYVSRRANLVRVADHGTRERWQHSGYSLEVTERAGVLAIRSTEENALDILCLRGFISNAERDAGMRFRKDYHSARLGARVVGSYDPARGCSGAYFSGHETSDAEDAAYTRWRNALRAIGMACSEAVISVACLDEWPAQKQLIKAKQGLAILAKWYGV